MNHQYRFHWLRNDPHVEIVEDHSEDFYCIVRVTVTPDEYREAHGRWFHDQVRHYTGHDFVSYIHFPDDSFVIFHRMVDRSWFSPEDDGPGTSYSMRLYHTPTGVYLVHISGWADKEEKDYRVEFFETDAQGAADVADRVMAGVYFETKEANHG